MGYRGDDAREDRPCAVRQLDDLVAKAEDGAPGRSAFLDGAILDGGAAEVAALGFLCERATVSQVEGSQIEGVEGALTGS